MIKCSSEIWTWLSITGNSLQSCCLASIGHRGVCLKNVSWLKYLSIFSVFWLWLSVLLKPEQKMADWDCYFYFNYSMSVIYFFSPPNHFHHQPTALNEFKLNCAIWRPPVADDRYGCWVQGLSTRGSEETEMHDGRKAALPWQPLSEPLF